MLKHVPSGRFYSRIQVGGTRTMKALKTKIWRIAKLRHLDKIAKAERQRQRRQRVVEGRGLMGDLIEKYQADYLANTTRAKRSKASLKSTVKRLEGCWQLCFGSEFRLLKPQQVTVDHARRIANYMHTEAEYRWHNTKKPRKGYGAITVNKTIELLHRVLRIAVETGALPALMFELDPVVGEPIRKHEERKKLRLPSSEKMQELFAQMRVIDYKVPDENAELRAYLIDRAAESADFAEFMAYSGARVGEAAVFRWEDELEKSVILRGTKSENSADREVPKIAALRAYGLNLGLAFQLTDDALDYGGKTEDLGKNAGDDFREGKATLPLLIAIARSGPREAEFWQRVIGDLKQTEADFKRAREVIVGVGALEATLDLAADYAETAKASLALFDDGEWRRALEALADFAVTRAV